MRHTLVSRSLVLLGFVLLLALLPAPAAAASPFLAGDGTEENPYLITDQSDLANLSYDLSACYLLYDDITPEGE